MRWTGECQRGIRERGLPNWPYVYDAVARTSFVCLSVKAACKGVVKLNPKKLIPHNVRSVLDCMV